MKWPRRKRPEVTPEPVEPQFSDVRIIARDDPDDESSDRSTDGPPSIEAELSAAFSGGLSASAARPLGDDDDTVETSRDGSFPAEPERTTIAIGGGDDMPDAVYLDDGLDDDSGTVFIDDDGTGDAIAAKDATDRGIEPRLRQRRIGVRRAEGRRRLRVAALVGAGLAVVVGVLAVFGSSLFSVDSIDVTGLRRADPAAVEAVLADLQGEPVLLVDTTDAEERLEAIPYVEGARVRTDFPGSVTIELRERTPVATVQGTDGSFRVLDVDGRVLDVLAGRPVAFVWIAGTAPLDLAEGQFAGVGYASAASIVTKLTPAVRSRLVSVSVTPDGSDMRFVLSNDPNADIEVRMGRAITDDDQIERLVRLERVLDDESGSDTSVIDVSTAETTER